jgi:hypothetical protein
MPFMKRLILGWKALKELGFKQVGNYALYQLGLKSGWFRLRTPTEHKAEAETSALLQPLFVVPKVAELRRIMGQIGLERLRLDAEEIVAGKVRLFGGDPVELKLNSPGGLTHWSRYRNPAPAGSINPHDDIRWVWEYGRFGWAFCLARAYLMYRDERYSQSFWEYTELFLESNPTNLGAHWASSQEVALRLISMIFTWHVFRESTQSTPERGERLSRSIVWHAERILPTLIYAQAQNNNHLLSESAGLYTAGLALPTHPQAARWQKTGWYWFNRGLQMQITSEGEYSQHSSNYQRMMLQLALWVGCLASSGGAEFPGDIQEKLKAATHWLLALCEPASGRVPNLGANDGSNLMPLSSCAIDDYRPVFQTAARAFIKKAVFPAGLWDEESAWLGLGSIPTVAGMEGPATLSSKSYRESPATLNIPKDNSWGYLRCTHFRSRPSHADQLHLDLWWRGWNIAQDAGTYLYNAGPPWDNSLTGTDVHNTLTINGMNQMQRAGRFLWLDWAQARLLEHWRGEEGSWERLVASQVGYRKIGVEHRRTVTAHRGGKWEVLDQLLAIRKLNNIAITAGVHWLLPDWEWEIIKQEHYEMRIGIKSPLGLIVLTFRIDRGEMPTEIENLPTLQVIRAGKLLKGDGETTPNQGWVARTYGYREPALSLKLVTQGIPGLSILSTWQLPVSSDEV